MRLTRLTNSARHGSGPRRGTRVLLGEAACQGGEDTGSTVNRALVSLAAGRRSSAASGSKAPG
jgi:hypothetical protein